MQDHRKLFQAQLKSWALATKNYQALSDVLFREFQIDNFRVKLQCNPGRIVSSSAIVSKDVIQTRPCFLCAKNRPADQESLTIHLDNARDTTFEILVNPFPVFPQHFTIAATKHQPQTIKGHFSAFFQLAKNMDDCVVFYNGPRCGASAPDHLHFQAGNKGLMPMESDYDRWEKSLLWENQDVRILKMEHILRNGWVLEGSNPDFLVKVSEQLLDILETAHPETNEEPMLNLLCWHDNGHWTCLVFPRKAHRPDCYYKEDETKRLISPASVEMGGLMIAARLEDFKRMNEKDIREIYNNVSVSKKEIDLLSAKFTEKLKTHL